MTDAAHIARLQSISLRRSSGIPTIEALARYVSNAGEQSRRTQPAPPPGGIRPRSVRM
jgi:hypothetical protein